MVVYQRWLQLEPLILLVKEVVCSFHRSTSESHNYDNEMLLPFLDSRDHSNPSRTLVVKHMMIFKGSKHRNFCTTGRGSTFNKTAGAYHVYLFAQAHNLTGSTINAYLYCANT
jgi:hypothetical protein